MHMMETGVTWSLAWKYDLYAYAYESGTFYYFVFLINLLMFLKQKKYLFHTYACMRRHFQIYGIGMMHSWCLSNTHLYTNFWIPDSPWGFPFPALGRGWRLKKNPRWRLGRGMGVDMGLGIGDGDSGIHPLPPHAHPWSVVLGKQEIWT